MLNWDDVIQRHPDCVAHESDGELVVVMPETGKFVVLNATGARVLELADGSLSLATIAATVAEEFKAPVDVVRKDVKAFSEALLSRGAMRVVNTAG